MSNNMLDNSIQIGALAMVAVSLAVVAGLAWMGNEQAQGSLISVVSAGVGYFLRGRVEKSD